MRRAVWILPVGLEYERVLESLGRGGNEFHIIYSATNDDVGRAAEGFATRIKTYLEQGPFDVKGWWGVDVLDMPKCIQLLKHIVHDERAQGDDPIFRINVGTSSKIVTLAAFYVAAQDSPGSFELYYPTAKNYLIMDVVKSAEAVVKLRREGADTSSALDRLSKMVDSYATCGGTSRPEGGYNLVRVPVIPTQRLTRTQEAILRALHEQPMMESGSALAEILFADEGALGAKQLDGAKSTVSFALKELIKWDLVSTRQSGKKKEIRLTAAGELYVAVFLSPYPGAFLGPQLPIDEANVPGIS